MATRWIEVCTPILEAGFILGTPGKSLQSREPIAERGKKGVPKPANTSSFSSQNDIDAIWEKTANTPTAREGGGQGRRRASAHCLQL